MLCIGTADECGLFHLSYVITIIIKLLRSSHN